MTGEAKTVLIAGAFGYGNAGDDAILRAMVKDLREQIAGVRIITLSVKPAETRELYSVEAVNWQDIGAVIDAAESSGLMILGGGGLFFDYWGVDPNALLTPRHADAAFCTGYCLLATMLDKPLMIYAVGVGPLSTEAGRSFTRAAFEQARVATVRDPESRSLLEAIGVPTERVRVTADPAFRLETADQERARSIIHSQLGGEVDRPLVGVAIRNWDVGVEPERWEREVASALDQFVDRYGGAVLFLPFHRAVPGGLADDPAIALRVRGRMKNLSRAVVLAGEYAPEERAALVAACDIVLGMRLHSIIFAIKAGVPAVALTYDPKVSNALAWADLQEYGIDLGSVTSESLLAALEKAYENRARLRDQLMRKSEALASLAGLNAQLAAELLAREDGGQQQVSPYTVEVLKWLGVKQSLGVFELQRKVEALEARLAEQARMARPAAPQAAGERQAQNNRARAADMKSWDGGDYQFAAGRYAAPSLAASPDAAGPRESVPSRRRKDYLEETASKNLLHPSPSDLALFIDLARHSPPPPAPGSAREPRRPAAGRKPRVAYLAYMLLDWQTREPRFGGGERYCLTLGRLLREQGFEVTFYQAAHAAFEGEYYGFKVVALPLGERTAEFQHGLSDAFYEVSADYDHVIYNLPEFASGRVRDDAIVICHGVWFDHNNYPPPIVFRTSEWFTHLYRAFSRPRKVVSVDTNAINVIRALWPELTSRITYIPNWVDTDLFRPPRERNSDPITILFPRRSQVNRGTRLLADILEKIPYDCRVRWVGEGEDEESEIIKGVARRDPRLEFYTASFEQMPSFYQEADICVISTVGSEGTSLSCLEGLASGCAVVATNVGGLPNLIQPEVNGLLVDPEAGEIARGINRLIERAEERAYYQAAGIRTAGNFTRGVWEGRWLDLLSHLGWIEQAAGGAARESLSL